MTKADGDAPILPSKVYWWLVGLGLPLLAAAGWVARAGAPWSARTLPEVLALTVVACAAVLSIDGHVRRMPLGWRVLWAVGGAVIATLLALLLGLAAVLTALSIACHDGCPRL